MDLNTNNYPKSRLSLERLDKPQLGAEKTRLDLRRGSADGWPHRLWCLLQPAEQDKCQSTRHTGFGNGCCSLSTLARQSARAHEAPACLLRVACTFDRRQLASLVPLQDTQNLIQCFVERV